VKIWQKNVMFGKNQIAKNQIAQNICKLQKFQEHFCDNHECKIFLEILIIFVAFFSNKIAK